MTEAQFVDPAVSRRKFYREVREFRAQAHEYRRRGWYLVHAKFPEALVILATGKTLPVSILCGLRLEYSNYDAVAPSVRLVHPLTSEPYSPAELPTPLLQRLPGADPQPGGGGEVQVQPLMQAHGPEGVPFLCIAGVREYHEHPAHSGDHWELHRRSGAGRLVRLVEVVSKYGLGPIEGFNVQMIPKVEFRSGVPPE